MVEQDGGAAGVCMIYRMSCSEPMKRKIGADAPGGVPGQTRKYLSWNVLFLEY